MIIAYNSSNNNYDMINDYTSKTTMIKNNGKQSKLTGMTYDDLIPILPSVSLAKTPSTLSRSKNPVFDPQTSAVDLLSLTNC